MKKSIFILSFMAFALTATAQIEGGDDGFTQKPGTQATTERVGKRLNQQTKHYSYMLSVGPRVGAGVATMSEGDGLEVYDGSGLAFGGGVAANIRFGGKDSRGRALDGQGLFGIGLELNYKSLSVKTLGDDDLKLGYFEVPVMFQFYPLYKTKQLKNLYIEVGPTIAGTMSASPDMLTVGGTAYKTGDLKGFDVKAFFNKDGIDAQLRLCTGETFVFIDGWVNGDGTVDTAQATIPFRFDAMSAERV